MAFTPLKKYDEVDFQVAVIANSQKLTIGDVMMPGATTQAPYATPAINGTSQYTGIMLGVVRSILTNGKPAEVNSITVASDNQTTGLYSVEYIPCYYDIKWLADCSADLGTTTGSDTYMAMFYLGYNSAGHTNTAYGISGQLDETSVAVFTTQLQFFSYGAYKEGNVNATTGKYTQVTGKFCPTKTV